MKCFVWLALAGLTLALSACMGPNVHCSTDSSGHTTCIDFARPPATDRSQ